MQTLWAWWKNHSANIAFITGILLVIAGYSGYDLLLRSDHSADTEAVHVHADLLVYIAGQRVFFTDDAYQSTAEKVLHKYFHFHDNEDTIIHRHAPDLPLSEFFASLGFTLTDTCFTTQAGAQHCTDDRMVLRLYVNDTVTESVSTYVPQEADRILVYYGPPDDPALVEYRAAVTDRACIYSGTCPERGIAPPESCGLTCEI